MPPSRKNRPTLREVADHTDLSVATVARVFNNESNVSVQTRTKVLKALHELGYPSPAGNLIGLIVPDPLNPYFSQLGYMIDSVFEKDTEVWHLLVSSSYGRSDREAQLVERFRSLGVRGLIYTSSVPELEALRLIHPAIANGEFPVVLFDRKMSPIKNLDFVGVDNQKGITTAVEYLITFGHERIAFLCGLPGSATGKDRFEAFREAMMQNGLEVRSDWIYPGDYTFSAGVACAEQLIEISEISSRPDSERPTALLAANDLMALGVMKRLLEAGWVLPQQFSVIGFDGIEEGTHFHPTLTTISQPVARLAREAFELLARRMKEMERGESFPAREKVLDPIFTPGSSVTYPPR